MGKKNAKGCFREFCAEHRHSGLSAVELHEKFKRTDDATKECIRRKWEGKLKLTKFQLFCQEARGQGLSGKQLLQAYHAQPGIKPRGKPGDVKKKKHPSLETEEEKIASFCTNYKALADLKTSNATGYRYITFDNRARYAHAAYSYHICFGKKTVRSKGFATAELAAKALMNFMKKPYAASSTTRKRRRASRKGDDLDDLDDSDDSAEEVDVDIIETEESRACATTYKIPAPPPDWSLSNLSHVLVDVQEEGWLDATVVEVYVDGWFLIRVHAKDDSWTDFLNWQEEGKEWKRYAADETRQIVSATRVDPMQMPVSAKEGIVVVDAYAATANEDDDHDIEVVDATLVNASDAVDETVASSMQETDTSSQTEKAEVQAHEAIRRVCAQITGRF